MTPHPTSFLSLLCSATRPLILHLKLAAMISETNSASARVLPPTLLSSLAIATLFKIIISTVLRNAYVPPLLKIFLEMKCASASVKYLTLFNTVKIKSVLARELLTS